jgi:hypothetical protein
MAGVRGVFFKSDGNVGSGVFGQSGSKDGFGVYGKSASTGGYAGFFEGDLGYTGSFGKASDARLKKNIKPIDSAMDKVLRLHGVTYEWIDPDKHSGPGTQWGFIAQDVQKAFPNWVKEGHDGYKTVDTTGVDSLLVESVRTLNDENHALRADLAKLEKRLDAFEGGKHPLSAGFGASGFGYFGLGVAATALVLSRRKRS